VAKAVSYALIAVLALQVAFGQRSRPGDRRGVLREVARQPFGTWALVALAVGFAGYALWQFVRAGSGRGGDGRDAQGIGKRVNHAGVGAIYLASAVAAASLAVGGHSGGGDERAETARVLSWPFGQWIVGAAGLGFVAYGVANLWKAKSQSFREELRENEMSPRVRRWTTRSGVLGHAARGTVFVMVGVFLVRAALDYDPHEAVGVDGALAELARQTVGTWLLATVAVGLLAYAVFCLVQARYRRV
jgi:hypothetical protein